MFYANTANKLTIFGDDNAPYQTITWVHQIMPYVEQPDLYAELERVLSNSSGKVYQVFGRLNIVLCPSDETDSTLSINPPPAHGGQKIRYSQLSYACNSGVTDSYALSNPECGVDWPANGVFDHRLKGFGATGNEGRLKIWNTTLGDVVNGEGASNTIMFTENADLEEWNYAPTEYHVGVVWEDTHQVQNNTAFLTPSQALNKYPNGMRSKPESSDPDNRSALEEFYSAGSGVLYARPASAHSGGFNISLCSGSTRFVSESINYEVYAKLMTSNGKKYLEPGLNQPQQQRVLNVRSIMMRPIKDDEY
jgi:hypothetical protein